MPETTYIVLRKTQDAPNLDIGWTVENSNVPAASAEAAIRLACKQDSAPSGTYVAIPTRSFKPVTVKAETTTVLRLEDAS